MNDANFTWANIKNGIQYSNDIKNKFLESNLSKENGPFGYVDMIKEKLEAGENVPAFTEWIGNERSHNIDQPNSVLFYKKRRMLLSLLDPTRILQQLIANGCHGIRYRA